MATPLRWEELDDPGLDPRGWTLTTIGRRLASAAIRGTTSAATRGRSARRAGRWVAHPGGRVGDVLDDIAGWFARVVEALGEVSVGLLLLALALMTLQSALDALAWRNILRAAYPEGGVRFPMVFGAYAGGVAINNVLPAQAGTIAMLGLYRGMVGGATVPGLVGAQAVQTLFYAAAGAAVYALLLVTHPDAGEIRFDLLWDHPWLTAIAFAAAIAAVVLLARVLRDRLLRLLHQAREGAAIMFPPAATRPGCWLPSSARTRSGWP